MAEHQIIEHTDRSTGIGTGMIIGILLVLLTGVVVMFLFLGGAGRFVGSAAPTAPNTTNVNVAPPALAQPQSGPQINIPREIQINLNQPPVQVQVAP
jgi:flagellar basal body-associated protein FliL